MLNEIIITPAELSSRFAGEYDVITHQPYRVGDHIVRCQRCSAVIKTDYIDGSCPLCGTSPFIPMQFSESNSILSGSQNRNRLSTQTLNESHNSIVLPRRRFRNDRNMKLFSWLIFLSALVSPMPLLIEEVALFICEAMFGVDFQAAYAILSLIAIIAAVFIRFRNETADLWKRSKWGPALILIPAFSPYILLTAIWLFIAGVSIALALLAVVLCVGIMIGICKGFE